MRFCPKHFTLVDEVDCREVIVDCPEPVEFDPTKHVLTTCGPCDRTRVVPVDRIMQGRVASAGTCQLSVCAATIVPRAINPVERLAIKLEGVDPVAGPPGHDPDTAVPQDTSAGVDQAAKPRAPKKATSGK